MSADDNAATSGFAVVAGSVLSMPILNECPSCKGWHGGTGRCFRCGPSVLAETRQAPNPVAHGSFPVSSAEALIRRWESYIGVCRACYVGLKDECDPHSMVGRADWLARISAFETVIEDLRRELARANVRTHALNNEVSGPGAKPQRPL